MTIENRNLAIGTMLWAKYKKAERTCEVVAGAEGKVAYKLADGRAFNGPSEGGDGDHGRRLQRLGLLGPR